jgi:hypothetical protein
MDDSKPIKPYLSRPYLHLTMDEIFDLKVEALHANMALRDYLTAIVRNRPNPRRRKRTETENSK